MGFCVLSSIVIGSRRGNREKRKIYNKINVFGEMYFTYNSIPYRNYNTLNKKLRESYSICKIKHQTAV